MELIIGDICGEFLTVTDSERGGEIEFWSDNYCINRGIGGGAGGEVDGEASREVSIWNTEV